jgi:hypothetical protein
VHHQDPHRDLLEVLGEIGLGAGKDAVVVCMRAAGTFLPAADADAIYDLAAAAPTVRLLATQPGQHVTRPVTWADEATRFLASAEALSFRWWRAPP